MPCVCGSSGDVCRTCHADVCDNGVEQSTCLMEKEVLTTRLVSSSSEESITTSATEDREGRHQSSQKDEVGFLFVEDVDVVTKIVSNTCTDQVPAAGVWINVDLKQQTRNSSRDSSQNGSCRDNPETDCVTSNATLVADDTASIHDSSSRSPCPHCNLVLSLKDAEDEPHKNLSLTMDLDDAPHFDGTISNVVSTSHNNQTTNGQRSSKCVCGEHSHRRRSDAALLTGVAMTCQDMGHIEIQRIQIIFHHSGDAERRTSSDSTRQQQHVVEEVVEEESNAAESKNEASTLLHYATQKRRVALLITFAIPQLTTVSTLAAGQSIFAPQGTSNNNKRRSSPSKLLPPSTQLLLSIVRSDWSRLEQQMESLQNDKSQNDPTTTSLFPISISLEELYHRLRAASRAYSPIQHRSPPLLETTTTRPPSSGLLNLPKEVVLSFIAPYLRAQSLDALKCSCTQLHWSLRSVVPGLKLQLYRHQINSLSWMRRREIRDLTEDDALTQTEEHKSCSSVIVDDGDLHRAVSGGATACLMFRRQGASDDSGNSVIIRIDPQTGIVCREMNRHNEKASAASLSRKVARGGLLCDDPGLGKTITVLSLILQTMGLTTSTKERSTSEHEATTSDKRRTNDDSSSDDDDDEIFEAYWKEATPACFRRPGLNKLLTTLMRETRDHVYFYYPVDPVAHGCPDYFNVIERPICFRDIQSKLSNEDYYGFDEFQSDVGLCFRNAMYYNPENHPVHIAAKKLSKKFEEIVARFKGRNVRLAKKSFSRSCAKPNSSVALILEARAKQKLIDSLAPSSSTLLVVPNTLANHWEEQINLHLDTSYCTDKVPITYHYTPNRAGDVTTQNELIRLSQIEKTHCLFVFIDKATKNPLPDPQFLAMFKIVITTNQRLSNEWKNGSFDEELRSQARYTDYWLENQRSDACSLLKVHWLRLIVDEGHAMGRGSQNNAIQFASWIQAQRRWAMTGTPTPQTASQSGLKNLLGLMRFLQHDFFSARLGGDKVWQHYITRGWNEGNLAAFFHLRSLLLLLMVRHTKRDIEELPPPKFQCTFSIMSMEETTAYNTLVSAIQSNLVTTGMEGKTSGRQDSLLHRRQAKHARTAFSNVRLACCGGTRVVPTITQKNWDETIELLQGHGITGVKLRMVEDFLHRAVTEQLSSCMVCGMQLSTLMVLPCADLVCTECMDPHSGAGSHPASAPCCPVCDEPFDVDDFQRLQPGIEYAWKFNLEEEKKNLQRRRQASESNREGLVMHNLAMNGHANPAIEGGIDIAGAVALQPAPARRRRTRRHGDGHACEFHPASPDGKCELCHEEHDECVFIDAHSKCSVCHRIPEPCPEEESKFFYVIKRLEQLRSFQQSDVRRSSGAASRLIGEQVVAEDRRPLKVIVFSQFRPILNLAGHRLLRRFGPGCIAEYWGYARKQELAKFSKSRDCFCMLLGRDGSEGLDLSFVTHIFFLEEIWDKSVENQVISRAYRMGAKGHVDVEQLVAKCSVEQTMAELDDSIATNRGSMSSRHQDFESVFSASSSGTAKEYQSAKLHFLLKNLSLITNHSDSRLANASNRATGKRKRAEQLVGDDADKTCFAPGQEQVDRKPKMVRFAD